MSSTKELFLVGCYRSGTSLLRLMLGAHPNIFIPEETIFIPIFGKKLSKYTTSLGLNVPKLVDDIITFLEKRAYWKSVPSRKRIMELVGPEPSYSDVIRAVIASTADDQLHQLKYLGDKTPAYMHSIFYIDHLFPSSKVINVVRDVRDIATSVKKEPFWGGRTPMLVAEEWNRWILNGILAERILGSERVLSVHYERLVESPRNVLQDIMKFLDLTYSDDMLEFYKTKEAESLSRFGRHRNVTTPVSTASVGRYKKSLSLKEIEAIERESGNTLLSLGYEVQVENILAFRRPEKFFDYTIRSLRMILNRTSNLYISR